MEASKNPFTILKEKIFYETQFSQFRFQSARAGKEKKPYISIIKFYKTSYEDKEWKPSCRFISLPLASWCKFQEFFGDFIQLVDESFEEPTREKILDIPTYSKVTSEVEDGNGTAASSTSHGMIYNLNF